MGDICRVRLMLLEVETEVRDGWTSMLGSGLRLEGMIESSCVLSMRGLASWM